MAECIQINDNTWRFEDGHVRFFLFCGTEKAALIDSGMNTPDARQMAEALTDLDLILINTHADRDHTSGNTAFDEFYMSPAEEPNYLANGGAGTIIPVREGDIIDLGDRELKVIDIPGHTPGSIALLDLSTRVLVSGDSVQDGDIFMFGEFRNIEDYIRSLEHLGEYEGQFDVVYGMHGSFPVGPDLIPQLLECAKEIRAGKATGTPVNVFGHEVCLYKYGCAGFLCEK